MNGSLSLQSFTQPDVTAVARPAESKIREEYSVADTGAKGDGIQDDSAFINNAVLNLIGAGGGVLHLLNGKTYVCNSPIVFPAGLNRVIVEGHGAKVIRGLNMPAGEGMFDLRAAQSVCFRDIVADGNTLAAQGVLYSQIDGNPLAPILTLNTSFWLHGGCADIDFERVTIQHTGGYAILSDTTSGGNNSRVRIRGCQFINNRPHLFGTAASGALFGSWTGGILYAGDCGYADKIFVTQNLTVTDCFFERNTGIGVWGHNVGYHNFHSGIVVANNSFLDQGLDAIEVSCTITGGVVDNTGRRIGYICTDDDSPSVPKYLPGLNATFIDHSGYVEGVAMSGNTCTSVCGGFCSLDGYAYGAVTGNNFRQPQPGDAFYVEDQIALIPAGVVYGFDCANTYGNSGGIIEQGGAGIALVGNALYGCSAGSIIAIAVRESKIADNDIWQPGNSTFAPILIGNQSAHTYQQAHSNSITGNRIYWSPATPKAAIIESETWSGGSIPWLAGEYNWIEKNHIFDTGGNAFEVSVAPSTVTLTGPQISSSVANPTAAGYTSFKRVTAADGTAGYTSILGTTGTEYFRFADAGILTVNGGLGTGVVAYLFNSTAVGADHAIQQSAGNFFITGAGNAFLQTAICTTVFSSRSDLAGSPATTAAFQTSGGNMVIYGNGYANFQTMAVALLAAAIVGIGGGTGVGNAILSATTAGLFLSLNGAAAVKIATGSTGAAGSSTEIQYNTAGAFDASANLIYGAGFLIVGGAASTGVEGYTFSSNATGTDLAFGTGSGTFSIDGAGDAAFQSVITTNVVQSGNAGVSAGQFKVTDAGHTLQTGFTGTLAAAIAAGKNVVGGIIVA